MIWVAAAIVIVALIVAVTVTLHKSMNMHHALNLKRLDNTAADDARMAELSRQMETNESVLAIEKKKAERAAYEYGATQARLADNAIRHLKDLPDERQAQLLSALERQLDGTEPPWKMRKLP